MQEATQLEIQDVPASDKGSTTSQEIINQTQLWMNHMLPNCAIGAQNLVVTKTYSSWTLFPQQNLITATSSSCWLQRVC